MKIDYNEPVKYTGGEEVNLDYHHGQLKPAVGINSVQVLRANREHPEEAEGPGWTYNHAPMLACCFGRIYLEYLSTPVAEHVPPGRSLLTSSSNGIDWETPRIIFPEYRIPDGAFEYDGEKLPPGTSAVMHQRMGFHSASNGRFLVLGNYGICPTENQVPFGRFSIGRVVREIRPDQSLGPVFFIRYNVNTVWDESNTNFPFYTNSADPAFVDACEALLGDPLVTQQWAEEQGDADELIMLKSQDGGAYYNKAFCWYRLEDGSIVGLWKWMKCAVTRDDGNTWSGVAESTTVRHAGAKIWGQRTSDGRFALVYNPHTNNTCRWPLAVVTGDDGLNFDRMMCAAGDLPPKRYAGGPFKGLGFHYVRGIETDEGRSPDGALYVAYSVNKEDIWVSRIPVPVTDKVGDDVHDDFSEREAGTWVDGWNIYSPKWAPVRVGGSLDGSRCLILRDEDPYDYAKAERIFSEGTQISADVGIMARQSDRGVLYVELWDGRGKIPFRVIFEGGGALTVVHGRKREKYADYEAHRWYDLKLKADCRSGVFDVELDGRSLSVGQVYQGQSTSMEGWFFNAPVKSLERIVFRTAPLRRSPSIDDDWRDFGTDSQPGAGDKVKPVEYCISRLDVVSRSPSL